MRTVIIDGDILVYKTATALADSFEVLCDEDDTFIYRKVEYANKQDAKNYVDKFINKICKNTKSDNVAICLSDREHNFRKDINPNYKGNRKQST